MEIGILGINHKSAELSLREKLAHACEKLFCPARSAYSHFSSVLLSTCNRIEIYFHSQDPAETHTFLLNAIRAEIAEEFEHRIYSYFGSDCFLHLARVTAGVDSAIIGETEIQGQVKRAYERSLHYQSLAPELHFLFQKSLKIGKNIRSHTQYTHGGGLSIQEAVLHAGWEMFGDIRQKRILLVGLSEINFKIIVHLKKNGLIHLTLCNRTFNKAAQIAEKENLQLLSWENLKQWPVYDMVIFATKCPYYLLDKTFQTEALSDKLIIDLSVPRNVDPKVGRHPNITLLNVDQLNRVLDRRRRIKAMEIARLETRLIAQAVKKQVAIYKMKELHRSYALLSQVG
jgi:glutamyl-tRNA reductase